MRPTSLTRLLAPALLALPAAAQIPFSEPPVAPDVNPAETVVEVFLEADDEDQFGAPLTWQFLPGVDTHVWAYNGSVPGPTIMANVGDTVRVHFTNELPEPTTIHWHGVELPAVQDGSHIAQRWVYPGETFTYEFEVHVAALYWYHPHVRTFDQVEKGLQGLLWVQDPAANAALGFTGFEEHLLVFDDVLLDDDDQILPAFDYGPNGAQPDPLAHALYQLNGREGNVLLVNGKDASQVRLTVTNGVPQRWHVVNSANTTFCRLDINDPVEGLGATLWEVAGDGGLLENAFPRLDVTSTAPTLDHPQQALLSEMGQGILLLPAERMDLIFTPIGNDGDTFRVYQNDWFRGRHAAVYGTNGQILLPDDPMDGSYPKQQFIELAISGPDPGTGEFTPPSPLRTLPPVADPVGVLPVTFGHSSPNSSTGDVTFFAQADFSSGSMVPLPAKKITSSLAHDAYIGSTYIWEVTNLTHGDHPFHTHGFFFELLEYEFRDMDNPELNFSFFPQVKRQLKDTIRVPARLGVKGRSKTIARLRVRFSDPNRTTEEMVAHGEQATFRPDGTWTSGGWLFHCHILEHSGIGMLSYYELRDPADPFHLLGRFLPGTNGNPSLTAEGDLSPGSAVTFTLVNAMPSTPVTLVAGNIARNASFAGGTLVPGYGSTATSSTRRSGGQSRSAGKVAPAGGLLPPVFIGLFNGVTSPTGEEVWNVPQWNQFPSGTEFYVQAIIPDAGAPQGFALSNAVKFVAP